MMEVKFDKEMDALLRKAADRGVLVGDKPKVHLDADAIAAFAENAVPEKSRVIYTQHLAECDPCRKTLSNLITLNAAAEPKFAAAAAPVVASIPWYRKFFSAPNLAYVMGGLVLVLGGMMGFIILQNSYSGDVTVSQVQEPRSMQSANATATEGLASSSSNASVENANAVSNGPGEIPRSVGTAEESAADPNLAAAASPAPPPPASTDAIAPTAAPALVPMDKSAGLPLMKEAPAPKLAKDEAEDAKVGEKRADNDQEARKKDTGFNQNIREQNQQNQIQMLPNTSSRSVGPSRIETQRDNRVSEDGALRPTSAPSGAGVAGLRTAGGKKFELKQGIWYDTSYRGQGTKKVRRGTSEYRDLDGGLRNIADSIGGTVVIVWNGKAYRIQ
jgi:hypothetical protein